LVYDWQTALVPLANTSILRISRSLKRKSPAPMIPSTCLPLRPPTIAPVTDFDVAPAKRVIGLKCRDRRNCQSPAHLVDVEVGHADEANLTLLLEPRHRFPSLLDPGVGVGPVDQPLHDVRGSHSGPKLYDHPIAGRMVFEPMTLRYEDDAILWVMINVPVPETDNPAKLAKLLAASKDGATVQEISGQPSRPAPYRSPRTSRRK
jgi:hypothetical protein